LHVDFIHLANKWMLLDNIAPKGSGDIISTRHGRLPLSAITAEKLSCGRPANTGPPMLPDHEKLGNIVIDG
jgi:hypothetical protein